MRSCYEGRSTISVCNLFSICFYFNSHFSTNWLGGIFSIFTANLRVSWTERSFGNARPPAELQCRGWPFQCYISFNLVKYLSLVREKLATFWNQLRTQKFTSIPFYTSVSSVWNKTKSLHDTVVKQMVLPSQWAPKGIPFFTDVQTKQMAGASI